MTGSFSWDIEEGAIKAADLLMSKGPVSTGRRPDAVANRRMPVCCAPGRLSSNPSRVDERSGRVEQIAMVFEALPATAAWRHQHARQGFESVFVRAAGAGWQLDGHTSAVEEGVVWAVRYSITVDERWATRSARIWGWSRAGEGETRLDADGLGHWEIQGSPAPQLDGCLDIDLESSACTNAMPVHRLELGIGTSAQAPAAYVRAVDLDVERLEQEYMRLDDDGVNHRYRYRAPDLGFECRLVYDPSGLVLDYPGIATRVS